MHLVVAPLDQRYDGYPEGPHKDVNCPRLINKFPLIELEGPFVLVTVTLHVEEQFPFDTLTLKVPAQFTVIDLDVAPVFQR